MATVSPVHSPREQTVLGAELPVKATSPVQAAAAEVLKPKAGMVEKTMAKIAAKIQFGDGQAESVSAFLGAVQTAVFAIRDDQEPETDDLAEAYAQLTEDLDAGDVTTIIGYAKGMAAANILQKGASSDAQRAYIKEQVAAENPLFLFLKNPQAPAVEQVVVVDQPVDSPRVERNASPVAVEQEEPAAPVQKKGLSTTTKVVLAGTALLGLGLVAYKYAMPYFFPSSEQQTETPVLPPVVAQIASTVAETVTETASQVGANFMDAVQTAYGTSPNPHFEYYPQGTFFQAVNGTTPNPALVGSETTCPAVVQSIIDCATEVAEQVVTNTTQVFRFDNAPTFSTLPPTGYEYSFDAVATPAQPGIMDSIVQGAGNVTAWIAETATSLHQGAVAKAPVIGQAEAWVAQQAGNAVQFVQTQAPVVKDQVVEFAGVVGNTVKDLACDAISVAQAKLPEAVTVRNTTVDVAAGLEAAQDAVASVQDEHAGAGVLGTATLAVLWGAKKLKNAVCGARAPAPALPIHPGALFNIGTFPPKGRGNIAQIKSLLKANGISARIVDNHWGQIVGRLRAAHIIPAADPVSLARGNAQQAVQVIQAAVAAGQIA